MVQHNLVERYLRGELDEGTREAFEIHYLENPETLRELQVYEALREGMKQLAAEDDGQHALTAQLEPAPASSRVGASAAAANQSWLPAPLLAACFAMMTVATTSLWLWTHSKLEGLRTELSVAPGLTSDTDTRSFERMRGSPDIKRFTPVSTPGATLVLLMEGPERSTQDLIADAPPREVLVTVKHQQSTQQPDVIVQRTIKPDGNNRLTQLIPWSILAPGHYHIEILDPTSQRTTEYQFVVDPG